MTQGERVKKARKALGLTLEDVGKKVGVTKQTVSRIENGVNNVTDQMAKSICRELGVNYAYLIGGVGEMFSDSDDDFMLKVDLIMTGESCTRRNLIKGLVNAPDSEIEAIKNLVLGLAEMLDEEKPE